MNVRLEMASDGSIVSGRVFAIDGPRIILEEEVSNNNNNGAREEPLDAKASSKRGKDVRIVSSSMAKTITLLPGEKLAPSPAVLPALTKEQALRREKFASRRFEEALLRMDHSPEALRIFDVLAKTFDVEWFANGIRVKDLDVTLNAPYRTSDIVGTNVRAVERVRDIVRMSRVVVATATTSSSSVAPAPHHSTAEVVKE